VGTDLKSVPEAPCLRTFLQSRKKGLIHELKIVFLSFRRKPESRYLNIWTPVFTGVTAFKQIGDGFEICPEEPYK
jgi:hypothetical protein